MRPPAHQILSTALNQRSKGDKPPGIKTHLLLNVAAHSGVTTRLCLSIVGGDGGAGAVIDKDAVERILYCRHFVPRRACRRDLPSTFLPFWGIRPVIRADRSSYGGGHTFQPAVWGGKSGCETRPPGPPCGAAGEGYVHDAPPGVGPSDGASSV